MKKKSLVAVVASVALVAAIGIGSTLAYFTDNAEKTNVVTFGHVDIDLTETSDDVENLDNGALEFTNVVPNQTLSKVPVITVADGSETAYVRAKITFDGLTDAQQLQLFTNINVNLRDWAYNMLDGYFYYQKALSAEESATLFTEVTVPAYWGNEVADETFEITIKAEAIQADNFNPQRFPFTNRILGWNGVGIESYEGLVNTPAEEIDMDQIVDVQSLTEVTGLN